MSSTRSPRRRWALAAALAALVGSLTVGATESQAMGPVQVVFLNAVVGPSDVDVYLDASLLHAGMDFGEASEPVTLTTTSDHVVAMYPAVASPSATIGGRSDEPIEAGRVNSQPADGSFSHPSDAAVLRLANSSPDGRFYIFTHSVGGDEGFCINGFAATTFAGSADIASGGPGGGGAGVFGVGGSTSARNPAFSQDVVVQGFRSSGFNQSPTPYAFGAYDFGSVTFEIDHSTVYFGYGNSGSYGAAEVVVNCSTGTIVSARSVARAQQFPSSRFVPLTPTRLFDTRTAAAPSGALGADSTIDVRVAGKVGVPETGVSAVVLNVTAANAAGPGWITVFPTGTSRPTTSSLNLVAAGHTVPNLVTVPIGADGNVSFYSRSGSHLIADVSGYFVESDAADSGRFVPLAPDRVFDTRNASTPSGAVAPENSISVGVSGASGVPPTGVSAVVLNVTGISVDGPGFVTAWPSRSTRPEASNLNLGSPGSVAPNLVIVPLGADGSVNFFTSGGAHLFADVFGYFTDESAPVNSSGLFVPTAPTRITDTRPTRPDGLDDGFIAAATASTVEVAARGDVPGTGASAVLANVTATQAAARGFVTIWPSTTDQPLASNLNLAGPGDTRPNAVLVPLGGPGDIDIFSESGTHAIVDVFGYFTV